MAIKDNIINTFKQGSLLIKLIYINAAVFVAMGIVEILSKWFNLDSGWMSYLMLPSYVPRLIRQLWSVVTYMFMHAGVEHVLFNMLALYWFGQLFASFYSQKNLVGVYIFGGLCGALMYVSAFNLIPYYQSLRDCGYLVGASASVMAIMVACAAYAPDYRIRLFLVGDVRLSVVAIVVLAICLLGVTSSNAGGQFAHLGGALAGYLYARSYKNGKNIAAWIESTIDWIVNFFHRKPRMKVSYGNGNGASVANETDGEYNMRKRQESERVDRILEKIKQSGYDSLSDEERKLLFGK